MKKKSNSKAHRPAESNSGLFQLKPEKEIAHSTGERVHVLQKGIICRTESRAEKKSPLAIVVGATEGFIPLWSENLVMRWKFNEASLTAFQHAGDIKAKVRELFGKAVSAWDYAAPIRFTENADNADFQIVVSHQDDCSPQGCTLAQAFFPDAGRHHLYVYPKMFGQDEKEQVDTLTHEIGHVFGLRHFFAPELEAQWPSEVFGEHKPFSIMNYGANSELTNADKDDLHRLYEGAWNGALTKINGTPIKLVQPYHYFHG
jgi:hypothetical protein